MTLPCPTLMHEAEAMMREQLTALPRTARIAMLAPNDDVALGALAAFEAAGCLDRVAAVGQNADRLGRAALQRTGFPFVGSTSYAPENYGSPPHRSCAEAPARRAGAAGRVSRAYVCFGLTRSYPHWQVKNGHTPPTKVQ